MPVISGVVALGESLAIGFRALAISASYAAVTEAKEGEEVEEVSAELTRGQLIFAFAIAIGFAVLLFKVSPALITDWIGISAGWFVIVEGGIRVAVFVLYLFLISLIPDLRRVFQYHAAEHKAINAYEAGEELEPELVQRYSLIHPRCGTAFLLWVMVIAIFVFAFFGRPHWYWLIATRILLLPLIAGIAYELIRFAGKHQDNRILMVAAGTRHVAATVDDATAFARPDRSLDPGPEGSPVARDQRSKRAQGGGHGLMPQGPT